MLRLLCFSSLLRSAVNKQNSSFISLLFSLLFFFLRCLIPAEVLFWGNQSLSILLFSCLFGTFHKNSFRIHPRLTLLVAESHDDDRKGENIAIRQAESKLDMKSKSGCYWLFLSSWSSS